MSRMHGDDDRIDICEIEFEWDPAKAISNIRKHKVSFEEARTVFGDKKLLDFPDSEHSEDELRYIGIGRSESGSVLFVNFATRGESIRIISARLAAPWERRDYEAAN
jgi:uncharacterized DUF497 family protein